MSRKTLQFTLIEIIIAVSIFSLVAISLFMYSSTILRSWQQTTKRRNNLSEMLTLERVFSSVLSNMIPFIWPDPLEDDREYPIMIGEPDRLRCAYLHRLNDEEEGAIRFCELYVEDGILYMAHADRPFWSWDDVAERMTITALSDNVAELHFLYVDWNDDKEADWEDRMLWLDQWETRDSGRDDAPLAVVLTLRWEDGTVRNWMYRTMGNGYRERYGKWEALGEDEHRKLR